MSFLSRFRCGWIDSSRLQNTPANLRTQRAGLDQLSAVLLNQTSRQVHLQQQRLGQLRLNFESP